MVAFPWYIDPSELQDIAERYPADQVALAIESLEARRYSGLKVPCVFIFALYIGFVLLISAKSARHAFRTFAPKHYLRSTSRLGLLLRAHFWEAPLFGGNHFTLVPILGNNKQFTVQAPLRYQALIILVLGFVNVLPLFCFYWITPGARNVYWPDPHSHRSQIIRYLSDRTAVLAIGQLPLIILMSGRNSPIALLSGLEMNDLMLYHRYLARFTWLQVNIHSFGFIIEGIMARHLAEDLKTPCFNWGVAATAMMCASVVLSVRAFRNRHYEVFVFLHIIFGILALVGTYMHIRLLRESRYAPFIGLTILSAAIWAIDRLIRLMNRTYQSFFPLTGRAILSGTITALPGAHIRLRVPVPLTHVVVEGDRGRRSSVWKIAAGQHVRLTVPSIQWVGDHPFTVMATGRIDSHVGYFDLAIKAQRGLTRKLELAKGHHAVGSGSTSLPRIFGVMVEGPYGHLLEHIYFSDNLLLFGGGIGITYVLPHFVQFAQRRPEGTCKLVWMVRDMGCFEIIKDQLVSFAEERRLRGGLAHGSVSIDVHLTCSAVKNVSMNSDDLVEEKALGPEEVVASLEHTHNSGGPHIGNNADLKLVEPKETVRSWDIHRLSPYITITTLHGRASLLPSSHFPTSELSRTKYLSIVACGPAGMCDEARVGAVQTMAEGGWKGVEYVEECFSW